MSDSDSNSDSGSDSDSDSGTQSSQQRHAACDRWQLWCANQG